MKYKVFKAILAVFLINPFLINSLHARKEISPIWVRSEEPFLTESSLPHSSTNHFTIPKKLNELSPSLLNSTSPFIIKLDEPKTVREQVITKQEKSLLIITTEPKSPHLNLDFNQGFFEHETTEAPLYYFTAGDASLPFGQFSSAMLSPSLISKLGHTQLMPFMIGYKAPHDSGFSHEIYLFRTNTIKGLGAGVGLESSYTIGEGNKRSKFGISSMNSFADTVGLQDTGAAPNDTFGGFGSMMHGTQEVSKVPVISIHGNFHFDCYNLTAEWLFTPLAFAQEDLSYNGKGARPQAIHVEGGMDFITFFSKPASLIFGYEKTFEVVALNLPKHRLSSVLNVNLWENTQGSFEYRHDIDFSPYEFGNGAAPKNKMNQNSKGSGQSYDSVMAQISIYF